MARLPATLTQRKLTPTTRRESRRLFTPVRIRYHCFSGEMQGLWNRSADGLFFPLCEFLVSAETFAEYQARMAGGGGGAAAAPAKKADKEVETFAEYQARRAREGN